MIGFFCEWCDTPKKECKGFGYLDVTILYKDDSDVSDSEPGYWYFTEDRSPLKCILYDSASSAPCICANFNV